MYHPLCLTLFVTRRGGFQGKKMTLMQRQILPRAPPGRSLLVSGRLGIAFETETDAGQGALNVFKFSSLEQHHKRSISSVGWTDQDWSIYAFFDKARWRTLPVFPHCQM
jgi:hypothetical protein